MARPMTKRAKVDAVGRMFGITTRMARAGMLADAASCAGSLTAILPTLFAGLDRIPVVRILPTPSKRKKK